MTTGGPGQVAPSWIAGRPVPLDFGGPDSVPYEPMPAGTGVIAGLEAAERAAARDPEKTAIHDGVTRLSYREMLDRVHGLAPRIANALAPGVPVASLLHGSTAAPVVVLACALAGRPLIPIDAGHPRERAAALFEESGAGALIVAAGDDVDDGFVPQHIPRIVVDVTKATGAPRYQLRPIAGDAPLIVIFTSGSTGRPKGVAYGSADGVESMRRFIDTFHVNSSDVILGLASLSTGGMRDAFAALTTGATIRIVDLKRSGVAEVLRVMEDEGITLLSFVPTVLRTLMNLPRIEKAFQRLRALDLIGELTLASDIALFRSKLPRGCHISITLGTTETGAIFSWFVDESRFERGVVPVGYLCPDKAIAVIGEDGAPAAVGETGELLVKGQMALGSWQRGRLTDARFLIDPSDPGQRIYQTGDLVRLRPDGLVEFVGRRDRQVKIRGLWADLGDIESALRSVDGVTDAVVLARSRPGQTDALVAFVSAASDRDDFIASLQQSVVTATAEHMAPSAIHVLPDIPRLANYKPDLVRLEKMLSGAAGAG